VITDAWGTNGRGAGEPAPQSPEGTSGGSPRAEGKLALITREVAASTGADIGLLAVLRAVDGPLEVLSAAGGAPWDNHLPLLLPADGFVGRVLESGRTAGESIDSADPLAMPAAGDRLKHAAAAVIRPPDGPLGLLCAGFRQAPRELAMTLWLMESYSRLAALAFHDGEFLEELLAAATVDPLTGCLNSATIRSELDREIARAGRYGRALSCCFIDLDHFKRINDRDGHLHGSRVLAEVARVLRGGLREEDWLGRYGGDEFLVVLPETDEARASALAHRLRTMIGNTSLDGRRVGLDASIGVAGWQPGTSVEELLDAADTALMEAKRSGKAAVVEWRRAGVSTLAVTPTRGA
jgi:diguanylate cyclase (GGDEF)-like protein